MSCGSVSKLSPGHCKREFQGFKAGLGFLQQHSNWKREKIYGMVVWGVKKKVFPLQKLWSQSIALGGLVPLSAFICISVTPKSPNQGSLTTFYPHTLTQGQDCIAETLWFCFSNMDSVGKPLVAVKFKSAQHYNIWSKRSSNHTQYRCFSLLTQ